MFLLEKLGNGLRRAANVLSDNTPRGNFNCPVCESTNVHMKPLDIFYFRNLQRNGFGYNILDFETLNIAEYSCARCGSSDRDRLYALYLKREFSTGKNINLLDVAPAKTLADFIRKQPGVSYRSTDLYMDGVDDKQDIINMHLYRDAQFDFFICSHVFEHLPDDVAAMRELYRVLKKGGKGIAMVPLMLSAPQTVENPALTDISERWRLFGQDDHVRLYNKNGFVERLASAGFSVKQLGSEYFGQDVFEKNAILPRSVLYIAEKL